MTGNRSTPASAQSQRRLWPRSSRSYGYPRPAALGRYQPLVTAPLDDVCRRTAAFRATCGKRRAPEAGRLGRSGDRMLTFDAGAQTEAQNAYAAKLYARVGEALMLRWADVAIGDWRPQVNDCHANVSTLCTHDSAYALSVAGFTSTSVAISIEFSFSLTRPFERPDGTFYDITPQQASQRYPFITAEVPEEEYAALITGRISKLWHIK
jgi:hypothetical protein